MPTAPAARARACWHAPCSAPGGEESYARDGGLVAGRGVGGRRGVWRGRRARERQPGYRCGHRRNGQHLGRWRRRLGRRVHPGRRRRRRDGRRNRRRHRRRHARRRNRRRRNSRGSPASVRTGASSLPPTGFPQSVRGVSADESGNIWVAGGEAGLFVQGAARAVPPFGLADGLRPYGYLNGEVARFMGAPDRSPADPSRVLDRPVISVAGGPAGTCLRGLPGEGRVRSCVEVGHSFAFNPGRPGGLQERRRGPRDAHRHRHPGGALRPLHRTQQGRRRAARPREALQHPAHRLRARTKSVWFGANHGFAWGQADFPDSCARDGQTAAPG